MGKGGGRPRELRDEELRKHFKPLGGGRVKCKHCLLEFSASGGSTRMRAHINKLKGQGVRPCPSHNGNSNDLKHNLLHSQNDDSMSNEAGQIQADAKSSSVSNSEKEDFQMLRSYVSQNLRPGDIVFRSSCSHFTQAEFMSLIEPEAYLDSLVIDIFAEILTDVERKKNTKPSNWYLPVTLFSNSLGPKPNVDKFANFVRGHKMIQNYMSEDLNSCEKIFIPFHIEVKPKVGHFYLYIIHLKKEEIEIWDSLWSNKCVDETKREETTKKLLLAMEKLFEETKIAFTKFRAKMAMDIRVQPNGSDCGIFVINYMQQLDNYVKKDDSLQYDSNKEREDLALKLLQSDLNQEKQHLYVRAREHHAKVEKQDGNKRLRVNTSDDERGNRHDDLQKGSFKDYLLPTTDLIGKEFRSCTEQIWEWIMDELVSAIGVWGMGGSGKTALVTHIHNKLLEDQASSDMKVIWVTVSQNGISQLQKVIAKSIGLDISDELEDKRIAGKLLQSFKEMKKCVIILDDVWDHFFLKDVGFPMSDNRIKLILTTRIWEVCQGMDCKKNAIKVKSLDGKDGLALSENIMGLDLEEEEVREGIVFHIANECEGLPLAIVRIATNMKGKKQASEWRHILESLGNLDNGQYEVDKWVLPVLRSSYDFLSNKLQRFFLYFALSTRGLLDDFNANRLIRRFVYESIDETKKLTVQYSEGFNMLDKLQNHGMLERHDANKCSMHKFFRVLAIRIAEDAGKIMAKAYKKLTEIPSHDQWKEDLQKVFLTGNKIRTIPHGTCPKCCQISTLLLDGNANLNYISDDFFNNMLALKTIDLSDTRIMRLPESVSNLKCLIALLLSRCRELSYIPSLRKLTRLISLDVSFTAITEAPMGLESLVNLRCLNLLGTNKLVTSASLISKLINLECLGLDVTAQVAIQGLEELEVIVAYFRDISVFNTFVSLMAEHHELRSYHLCLQKVNADLYSYDNGINREYSMKRVTLCGMDLGNRELVLPEDMKELFVRSCQPQTGARNLCSVLSYSHNNYYPTRIERLVISGIQNVEYLCCLCGSCSFCSSSQLVGSLSLICLMELKDLVSPYNAHSLDESSLFSDLTDLSISHCISMETLMTPRLLALLHNLRTVDVSNCRKMKEIVGGADHSHLPITLPNLTSLKLYFMRELSSVYGGVMLCPSLQKFSAQMCWKLNVPPRIEISLGSALQIEKTSEGYNWEN